VEYDRRRVAFRLAVAVVIAAALTYGVGWDRVLRNLRAADPAVYALAPLGAALSMLVGAEGTRLALGFPSRSVRGSLARRAFFGAAIVRNLFPAGNVGGGGFVAYTVSRHDDVTVSSALAGVTSWEFVMMVASAVIGGLGIAGLVAAGGDPTGIVRTLSAFAVLLAFAVVVIGLVSSFRDRVARIVAGFAVVAHPALTRVSPSYDEPVTTPVVRRGLDEFFGAIGALADDRSRFAAVVLAAHATWVGWLLPLYASLLAVGLVVSPAVVMVAVTVSGFARALPLPAGIGPVDAAMGGLLVALTPHSVGQLASALVLNRAGTLLVQVTIGGAALWTLDVAATGGVPE
jgi:uncharacterized protein (TIRG00374 family)